MLARKIRLVVHALGLIAVVILIPAVVNSWLPGKSDLSGLVVIGNSPLSSGEVRLKSDDTRDEVNVPVVDGVFSVTLPTGRHSIAFFQNDPIIFPAYVVDVQRGESDVTIALPTGGANVSIVDANDAPVTAPMVLSLNGPMDDRLYQSTSRIVVEPSTVGTKLAGLSSGTYDLMVHSIVAGTGSIRFQVQEGATTNVSIAVAPNDAILEVRGPNGQPVAAQVLASGFRRIAPISPGRFPLAQVAPNERVYVAAVGFAPTCKMFASLSNSIDVVLARSRPSRSVLFTGSGAPGGEIAGVGGAECPLPLLALTTGIAYGGDSVLLETANLFGSQLRYVQAPGMPSIAIDSTGGDIVLTTVPAVDSCLRIPLVTRERKP